MWAHYADSHRGFAIGFNTASSFFKEAVAVGKLKRVEYESERVTLTRGMQNKSWIDPNIIFMTKSTDWQYEKEWRWLECGHPSDYAKIVSTPSGELLYLRPFEPETIGEIIIGYRADGKLIESLLALASSKDFNHLNLFKVVLHKILYKLEVEPLKSTVDT
jgi:hypothetical protein